MKSSSPPRIKKAIFWNYAQQFGQQGIKFLIGLWLARILDPHDFGLIAMVAVFTALSEKFIGMGFASSLVRKNDVDDTDCSTVFFTNLGIAVLAYLVLYAIAPQVARFYDETSLENILRVLGLALVIRATFAVQAILFTIRLDFKTPLLIGTIAESVAGAVGLTMAYAGYQVWSLVGFSLSRAVCRSLIFTLLSPWKPKLIFSLKRLRSHISYGAKITVISSIEVAFNHLHSVVIGRIYDSTSLGHFSRGKSLQTFATQNTISPLSRVMFPGFARVREDHKKLVQAFKKSLELTAFLILPLMTGMALLAEPLVSTILGAKWIATAPYLQLMCFIGAVIPFRNQCSNLLKALNRLNQIIQIQTSCRVLSIIAIFLSYQSGIKAMILAETVVTLVLGAWFLAASSQALKINIRTLLRLISPYFIASVLLAFTLLFQPFKNINTPLIQLMVSTTIGLTIYGLLCAFLRAPLFTELVNTILKRLESHRK